MSKENQNDKDETARKALAAEAGSVIRQLRESQKVAELFEDEENASDARRAADLIEKLMSQNAAAGSRYWIVTVDPDPMPCEFWTSPFQIVHGTEDFVKSYCDSLNAKKGPALYEYSDPANQEILFENTEN